MTSFDLDGSVEEVNIAFHNVSIFSNRTVVTAQLVLSPRAARKSKDFPALETPEN